MMKKGLFRIWLAVFWCVCLLALLGGATYAWFTFDPFTRVEPMSGSIGPGETTLLIAANPRDEFGTQCILPKYNGPGLLPVSTADCNRFYRAYSQDRQGISLAYQDVTSRVEEDTIHGTLYLKSLTDDCDVYFYMPEISFGQDAQMLSSLRLGLHFTTAAGEKTYIFDLSGFGNTINAEKRQTTAQSGVVVAGIQDGNAPVYVKDPAQEWSAYAAVVNAEHPLQPEAGVKALCTLASGEIATVEYWLYLEGCDENCVNEVQNREIFMELSFCGVANGEEE